MSNTNDTKDGWASGRYVLYGFVAVIVFLLIYVLSHPASDNASYVEEACPTCNQW